MKTLTKEEAAARFRADLVHLLEEWNAELVAEDHWQGYPECGQDVRMTVTIPAIYTKDGETAREAVEVDLGRAVGDSTWVDRV